MNCPYDAGLFTINELINKNLKRRIYVNTQHDYFVQCVSPKLINKDMAADLCLSTYTKLILYPRRLKYL